MKRSICAFFLIVLWLTICGFGGRGISGSGGGVSTSAEVVAAFGSGSCSGYLKSDGTCDTPSSALSGGAQYYLPVWTASDTLGKLAAAGSAGNPLISGGAAANPAWLSIVLAGGTNTFSITNGTASLDVAAGATLNIDTSLQVATAPVVLHGKSGGSTVYFPTALSFDGTMTNTYLCKYTSSGTVLSCDVDPAGYLASTKIGTLTNTKWCTSDGSAVICNTDAPAGSGDVTDAGDCAGGACYDGSADGGTYIRLYDGTSAYESITGGVRTFTFASSTADSENMTWTLGANDNTILLSSSTGANILNLTGFTVNATSFSAAASASPTILINDSDAPGTDKEIGKIVGAYIDGADGSENGTVSIYAHEAGTSAEYIQVDGKNVTIDLLKPVVTTGALTVGTDLVVNDDATLKSDAAVLGFGADTDVTLTHVADTGLTLNSTMKLHFGDTGTYVNQSADGVLAVVSDTEIKLVANDEDLKITKTGADGITIGTNTGVTTITTALNLASTGTIQGKIKIASDADGMDGSAMTAAGMYGTLFIATGAGTWTLPTAVEGMSGCLMDSGTAHDLILDVQADDDIQLKGTELSNGTGITNASGSTTGDFVCFVAISAGHWVTMGMQGTWASQ